MKKILVATPWYGEFGWELMRWQGYLRALSHGYDETIVLCPPEKFYLYQDFAKKAPTAAPDMESLQDTEIEYAHPSRMLCRGKMNQEFIKFGHVPYAREHVILCHARNDKRNVLGNRNWPLENWDALVKKINKNLHLIHLSICSIGSFEAAHFIPGTRDIRGFDLNDLADAMASAWLCVGPSSGPMHFASLCGCPHVVWTDKGLWRVGDTKASNRERYERIWNPFKTRVSVIDGEGWQPSIETVFHQIVEGLKQP